MIHVDNCPSVENCYTFVGVSSEIPHVSLCSDGQRGTHFYSRLRDKTFRRLFLSLHGRVNSSMRVLGNQSCWYQIQPRLSPIDSFSVTLRSQPNKKKTFDLRPAANLRQTKPETVEPRRALKSRSINGYKISGRYSAVRSRYCREPPALVDDPIKAIKFFPLIKVLNETAGKTLPAS